MADAIKNLIPKGQQIAGIGIGAPNGNYLKGTIEHAPNLAMKGIVPLADLVGAYFDVPVYLTNDANAAALGEHIYGGAKNLRHFIMITLGTGVGSGIYIDGRMVYGHDGFAGELGHTTVIPNGRQCNCGKKGCLETYCSANGLRRTVFELLANNIEDSPLRQLSFNEVTSHKIYEFAMEGDTIANKAFEITGDILGKGLADAVAFSSPEAIFIFGGLANAGEILFNPLRISFENNLLPIFRNKIEIRKSELEAGTAAIVGASALVWENISK